jgi:hypothetical protein
MCSHQCIVLCIIAFEKFPSGQYGMVNGETYHVPYRLPHSLQNNKLFLVTLKGSCFSYYLLAMSTNIGVQRNFVMKTTL